MAYTYHGASKLIKTGEATVVFPSGLIQKKVTVVGRNNISSNQVGKIPPLTQTEISTQLDNGFFAFPTVASGVDLNNGFVQYDIVGYKKGSGERNSDINYKYRKLSSFIVEDQFRPRTVNISVEVGVRSTIVLSEGIQTNTEDETGNTVVDTVYQSPSAYQGKLDAYNEGGSLFTNLFITEINTSPGTTTAGGNFAVITTTKVVYEPITVVESVSSTYYGHFTEYITTSSLKIVRRVLSQTTTAVEQ